MRLVAVIPSLFGIVILAMIPGFFILAQYQTYVLSIPLQLAMWPILEYITKFVISTSLMLAAIMIYADAVFPLVMCSFATLFQKTEIES